MIALTPLFTMTTEFRVSSRPCAADKVVFPVLLCWGNDGKFVLP